MPTVLLKPSESLRHRSSGAVDDTHKLLDEAHRRIGATLRGKWRLERLIGVGGMGAVYEARHRNGMRGAVKVLDVALSRTKDCRERFLREGRLANEVAHIGAVRVLDDDETEDGSAFLVMELLAGKTLDHLAFDRGGTLPPSELLRLTAQILDTLACAHARGIVHRDVKPENLLLTNDGMVKILDFGIARWNALGEAQRVTQSGEPIGTPAFMAPEQARGHWRAVDAQSDLYSLGATMFSLATGEPIHPGAMTVAELLVAVITRPARPVKQAGDVPDVVAEIIDRALSYDKRARYADAVEMRAAVEAAHVALTGEPIPPTPSPSADTSTPAVSMVSSIRARLATTIRRGRARTSLIAALAAPVAIVLIGAFVVSAHARTEPSESAVVVSRLVPLAAAAANVEPPPPLAPLAVQDVQEVQDVDDDDAPPQAKPNASPAIQIQPQMTHARAHEDVTDARASNVSRLSRRSTLFDRRY